jgi:sigma54-dependent transcription regulator
MPFGKNNKRDDRLPNHRSSNGAARHQSPLASQTNFEDDTFDPDDAVEDPAIVLENVLDSIRHAKSVANAYRKIFKVSSFDRGAKNQIDEAITALIGKWRSVQTLLRRAETNGKLRDA